MTADEWLADARASYDTVAESYADMVRDALAAQPHLMAGLTVFASGVGDGPVADVGCGPGHVTAQLNGLGVDAFGIDISPAMVEVARRDHPGLRFEVGSITALDLADGALAGVVAYWSLIHIPDAAVPQVLAQFRRVLRPGGRVLLGFHVDAESRLLTSGYGHAMHVHSHRRRPEWLAERLAEAGFEVEAQVVFDMTAPRPGALLHARRAG